MSNSILIETALQDLKGLLAKLSLGETVTLADEAGKPVALLVPLTSDPVAKQKKVSDWRLQMEALAKEVSAAWQGEKSALETLAEMRR